jgi:WD40 repeat protein
MYQLQKPHQENNAIPETYAHFIERQIYVLQTQHYILPDPTFINAVQNFLNNNQTTLLLLGQPGSGKTLFCYYLMQSVIEHADKKISIYINLADIADSYTLFISKVLSSYGFNEEEIEVLKQNKQVIFIFDNYGVNKNLVNLHISQHLSSWKHAKIIITCRPSYLRNLSNSSIYLYFAPFIDDKPQHHLFSMLTLPALNDSQIEDYLRETSSCFVAWQNYLEHNAQIRSLCTNPLMLNLLMQEFSHIIEEVPVRDIYQRLLDGWLTHQEQKLPSLHELPTGELLKQAALYYCQQLAVEMDKENMKVVKIPPYSTLFPKENMWNMFFNNDHPLIQKLFEMAPLFAVTRHHYSFLNEGIAQFFTELPELDAKNRVSHLLTGVEEDSARPTPKYIPFQIDLSEQLITQQTSLLTLFADRVIENEDYKNKLFGRVYASCESDEEHVIIAATNSITILNKQVVFSDMNLSDIKIPYANLSYGVFDGTQFNRANLDNVSFNFSWLRETDFSSASMKNVSFAEWPYKKLPNKITVCCYSHNGKWLAIGSVHPSPFIYIYGMPNCILIGIFKIIKFQCAVTHITFSPNNEMLAAVYSDNTIRLWDISTKNLLRTFYHDCGAIIFSSNGEQLISTKCVWDVHTGEIIKSFLIQEENTTNILSELSESKAENKLNRKNLPNITNKHLTTLLKNQFSFPAAKNFRVGKSLDNNGSFFDALAQTLNAINRRAPKQLFSPRSEIISVNDDFSRTYSETSKGKEKLGFEEHTEKSLRLTCYAYYEKNKALIDNWNIEDKLNGKIHLGFNQDDDYYFIQYTNFELEREFNGRLAIQGRYHIEGRMLCHHLNLPGIYIIELVENLNGDGYDLTHYLVTQESVKKIEDSSLFTYLDNIPTLIFSPSYAFFVPLLSKEVNLQNYLLDIQNNPIIFSSNGQLFVSGTKKGVLYLVDTEATAIVMIFEGHTSQINCAAFSPDSRQIISGSKDKTLRLWSSETGNMIKVFNGHTLPVTAVCFSSDGRYLFSGSDDATICVWNIEYGNKIKTFIGHKQSLKGITCMTISKDNGQLMSGDNNGVIRFWDIKSSVDSNTFKNSTKVLDGGIILSFDGKQLISWTDNNKLCYQDITTNVIVYKNFEAPQSDKAYDDLHISSQELTYVYDADSNTSYYKNAKPERKVQCVSLSPDGTKLMSGNTDGTLTLWDVETGCIQYTFNGCTTSLYDHFTGNVNDDFDGHTNPVSCLAWSANGKLLISGSQDCTLRLWDIEKHITLKIFRGQKSSITSIAWSKDERQLISSGVYENTLYLWNMDTGAIYKKFEKHTGLGVYKIVLSDNSQLLVSGGTDNILRLWDINTGTVLKIFRGHTDWVRCVAFSPDSKQLVSGSNDGTIRFWDIDTATSLITVFLESPVNTIYWQGTAEEAMLLSCNDDMSIRYWRLNYHRNIPSLRLLWTNEQSTLIATNACCDKSSLSLENVDLLKQRGAIGEPLEKEKTDSEALEIVDPAIAAELNYIGSAHSPLGGSEEMLEYYERALKININLYGLNHPNVAIGFMNIGSVLAVLGNVNLALKYYKKVMKIYKDSYELIHPNVVLCCYSLASIFEEFNDFEKASEFHDLSIVIHSKLRQQIDNNPKLITQLLGEACDIHLVTKEDDSFYSITVGKGQEIIIVKEDDIFFKILHKGLKDKTIVSFIVDNQNSELFEILMFLFELYGPGVLHGDYNNLNYRLIYDAVAANNGYIMGTAQKVITYYEKVINFYSKTHGQNHHNVAVAFYDFGKALEALGQDIRAEECFQIAVLIRFKNTRIGALWQYCSNKISSIFQHNYQPENEYPENEYNEILNESSRDSGASFFQSSGSTDFSYLNTPSISNNRYSIWNKRTVTVVAVAVGTAIIIANKEKIQESIKNICHLQ